VAGYTIVFTFADAGEPGTKDTARYLVWKDNDNDGVLDNGETPVLSVSTKKLDKGNHQAHKENGPPPASISSPSATAAAPVRSNTNLCALAIQNQSSGAGSGAPLLKDVVDSAFTALDTFEACLGTTPWLARGRRAAISLANSDPSCAVVGLGSARASADGG